MQDMASSIESGDAVVYSDSPEVYELWPHLLDKIIGASVRSVTVYGLTDFQPKVFVPRAVSTLPPRHLLSP